MDTTIQKGYISKAEMAKRQTNEFLTGREAKLQTYKNELLEKLCKSILSDLAPKGIGSIWINMCKAPGNGAFILQNSHSTFILAPVMARADSFPPIHVSDSELNKIRSQMMEDLALPENGFQTEWNDNNGSASIALIVKWA
jgi:hypothetical protein